MQRRFPAVNPDTSARTAPCFPHSAGDYTIDGLFPGQYNLRTSGSDLEYRAEWFDNVPYDSDPSGVEVRSEVAWQNWTAP